MKVQVVYTQMTIKDIRRATRTACVVFVLTLRATLEKPREIAWRKLAHRPCWWGLSWICCCWFWFWMTSLHFIFWINYWRSRAWHIHRFSRWFCFFIFACCRELLSLFREQNISDNDHKERSKEARFAAPQHIHIGRQTIEGLVSNCVAQRNVVVSVGKGFKTMHSLTRFIFFSSVILQYNLLRKIFNGKLQNNYELSVIAVIFLVCEIQNTNLANIIQETAKWFVLTLHNTAFDVQISSILCFRFRKLFLKDVHRRLQNNKY